MKINDIAPDLEAAIAHGTIHSHNWPGCTAGLKPKLQKRNWKIIGFKIDPVNNLSLRLLEQPS